MKHEHTQEQKEIITIEAPGTYGISAFAGTGKTTTLVSFAEQNPNKKILYIVYNKNMKEEAERKMPTNVTVLSAFGLAYQRVFGSTKLDRSKICVGLSSYDIKNFLSLESSWGWGKAIKISAAFNKYCSSVQDITQTLIMEPSWVREGVETLYNSILDGSVGKIPHNFYYKYFERNISELLPVDYDVIMVDEAQDSDEIIAKVIKEINCDIKIVVGDEYQKIYGWRGAINVFQKLDFDRILYLSTSFRFSEQIAEVANDIIKAKKGEYPDPRLKSSQFYTPPTEIESECWISRTNANAVKIVLDNPDKVFKLNKSTDDLSADFSDTLELSKNKPDKKALSKNRKYMATLPLKERKKIFENEEINLNIMLKIIKSFGQPEVQATIASLKSNASRRKGVIILGTAHSVKGLEYDRTVVMDDFKPAKQLQAIRYAASKSEKPRAEKAKAEAAIAEEFNLLYVAHTRGRS